MKQKRNYSLTAKERKAKRYAEQNKTPYRVSASGGNHVAKPSSKSASGEQAMLRDQRQTRRSALIVGGVIAVAVILIIVALITPVILFVINPYRGYKDVIARFSLSNGMILEYVIDEDEYDTAATNFIFLATNKYFDNTVFYDAQGGWLRFGGYESQPTDGSSNLSDYKRSRHHAQNTDYCKNFSALPNNRFNKVTDKFGYRLRADSDGKNKNMLERAGSLAYRYNDTATEFQFYYGDFAETVPGEIKGIECTMVGHALNDDTIKNIQAIARTAKLNTSISSGYQWKPPTPTIKIESVKVYNLNDSKWKNFDFLKYVNGNDKNGSRRLTSWVGIN